MQRQSSLFIFRKEYETMIFELAKGEGSTMTFAQTVATIHNQVVTAKPREISLVRNLKRGLDYVLDLVETEQMQFSKYHLCAINNLVGFDDNHDNLGDFRKGSKHQGVNPLNALDEFEKLVKKFNNEEKTDGY